MNPRLTSIAQRSLPKETGRNHLSWARLFPYHLFFAAYAIYATYFLIHYAIPYLASMDLYAPRLLADSITYETICVTESNFFDLGTLRDIGPCIGLRMFNYDTVGISLFNAAIIIGSSLWLARSFDRSWKPVLTLVLLNPITFLSLFGPNKEVFGIAAIMVMAIYMKSRSPIALLACLVAALFNRLPILMIISLYLLAYTVAFPWKGTLDSKSRHVYHLVIIAMMLIVSVIAATAGGNVQYSLLGDVAQADEISKATTFSLSADYLSGYGLYPVVYGLRMILNLYSGAIGFINLGLGATGIYYNVGVVGSSILFVLLSAVIALRGKARRISNSVLGWNVAVFVTFYTLVINLSPMIQHRYFYPLYVFLILIVVPARTYFGPSGHHPDDAGRPARHDPAGS